MSEARSSVSSHPHLAEIERRWRRGEGAVAIARWLAQAGHPALSDDAIWRYGRKHWQGEEVIEVAYDADSADGEIVAAVEHAKAEAAKVGGKVKQVTIESRQSTWDAQTKGGLTELESQRRGARVTVVLPAEGTDEAPFEIRQATPIDVKLRMPRPGRRDKGELRTAVVFPDIQFPFHDAAAVDVAEQLAAYVEQAEGIDDLVWLGDDLDFPEVGKHRTAPALLGSMQDGIEACYQHKARVRAIAPDASAYWLMGNHEARLTNWLVDNGPLLIGLRRADAAAEDPVLSVEFLCRTQELGIEVVGPYPEGTVWLTDSLRLEHGRFTGPHPEAKYLGEIEASTIYGHTHRAVLAFREIDRGPRGLRSYFAGSPGCLCRLDGKLPSTKSGVDATGKPGQRHAETWQQGVMVLRYNPAGGELPSAHIVRIINGAAEWEGRRFTARCDVDGNPLD
jgi:hypothetical protein